MARVRFLLTGENRTDRAFRGVQRNLQATGNAARNLLATFGLTFGAAGIGLAIKRQLDMADQTLKLTQRIGGSTEALSEYRFVAERAGITFQTFTMGLQRMTRRLGEAADGKGEARDALHELGIDAKQLINLSLDRQFETIADALSRVENASRRAALAQKVFDSEGVALLQTMERGAAGIREVREEARRLGITLDRDAAEKAAEANDAMTEMRSTVGALARDFAVKLAPAIQTAAQAMRQVLGLDTEYNRLLRERVFVETQIRTLQDRADRIRRERDPEKRRLLEQIAEKEAELAAIDAQLERERVRARSEAAVPALRGAENARAMMREADRMLEEIARVRTKAMMMSNELAELPVMKGTDRVHALMREADRTLRGMTDTAREHGSQMSRALEMTLFAGFDRGAEGMVESFKSALQRMIAAAAASRIAEVLVGLGGGGAGTAGGFFGKLFGGSRQTGGPVEGGKIYRTHGDVYVPHPGTMVPKSALAGAGGPTHVEIHNHFDTTLESLDKRVNESTAQMAGAVQGALSRRRRPRMA